MVFSCFCLNLIVPTLPINYEEVLPPILSGVLHLDVAPPRATKACFPVRTAGAYLMFIQNCPLMNNDIRMFTVYK